MALSPGGASPQPSDSGRHVNLILPFPRRGIDLGQSCLIKIKKQLSHSSCMVKVGAMGEPEVQTMTPLSLP